MSDNTRVMRRPRRACPAPARTAAAIIAAAGLALLAAACGGSPTSAGSGGSPNAAGPANSRSGSTRSLAYSRCVRSHGVPGWPDPTNGSAGWGFNLVHVQGFNCRASTRTRRRSIRR
jgi:hypothetical protein